MGTQAVVTFVADNQVIFKVIAGVNGYPGARDFMERVDNELEYHWIPDERRHFVRIYHMAERAKLGSNDDLVLMYRDRVTNEVLSVRRGIDDLDPLYVSTFDSLWFNPRWSYGLADEMYVYDLRTKVAVQWRCPYRDGMHSGGAKTIELPSGKRIPTHVIPDNDPF